jgi:AcrR family transcriptional regulator
MPISDCEVRDPRIRRTRQLLQEALRKLMQEKSFEEISVQDIAEVATVNRATFYDHYADKFALLEAMAAGGFHKMLHERNVLFDGTCPSAASAIILATCDYLESTCTSEERERQHAFAPLIDAALVAAIRRTILRGIEAKQVDGGLSPEIVASSASWAIYGAVKEWHMTPDHVRVREIVGPVLKLVVPILMLAGAPTDEHVAEEVH